MQLYHPRSHSLFLSLSLPLSLSLYPSLSPFLRERERDAEKERGRERELLFLFLKGMTGALAPFSYLVVYILCIAAIPKEPRQAQGIGRSLPLLPLFFE